MPKPNRKCLFCNHSYYFCPSCNDNHKPSWYALFDCEECKELFDLLTDEFLGKISTDEVKNILELKGIGLDGQYSDGIRKHIERVLSYDTNKKSEKEELENIEEKNSEEEIFPMNPPEVSLFETESLEKKPIHKKKKGKTIVKNINSPTQD